MCVAAGTSLLDGAQALWAFGDQAGMAVGPSLFHLRSVLSPPREAPPPGSIPGGREEAGEGQGDSWK